MNAAVHTTPRAIVSRLRNAGSVRVKTPPRARPTVVARRGEETPEESGKRSTDTTVVAGPCVVVGVCVCVYDTNLGTKIEVCLNCIIVKTHQNQK